MCITHTPFNECHLYHIIFSVLFTIYCFCSYLPKNRINLQNRCLNNRKYTAIILYLVVHENNNNNSIKCIVVSNWIYPFGALWGPDGTPRYNSMSPKGYQIFIYSVLEYFTNTSCVRKIYFYFYFIFTLFFFLLAKITFLLGLRRIIEFRF